MTELDPTAPRTAPKKLFKREISLTIYYDEDAVDDIEKGSLDDFVFWIDKIHIPVGPLKKHKPEELSLKAMIAELKTSNVEEDWFGELEEEDGE